MKNYFQEILQLKGQEVEYEPSGYGHIKMVKHHFPFSIREKEFDFLRDLIIRYNLKNGFELGTGMGVSTAAIGLGFKYTGGKLVTIDSYIEEHLESYGAYEHIPAKLVFENDGYKSAQFLINHFKLQNHVFPEIGWSPNDITRLITKHLKSKIDFIFYDGGHFDHQLVKDIEVIQPLLAENFVIAFHDFHPNFFTDVVMNTIEKVFKKPLKIAVPRPDGEDLSIIINK